MTNDSRTMTELSDAELDCVTGGVIGRPFLIEGNGNPNIHANSPFTPAAENGLNSDKGNGAHIGFI